MAVPGKVSTFATVNLKHITTMANKNLNGTETLTFANGDGELAFIVTNGEKVRVYTTPACDSYDTLGRAIAHLEAAGYQILTDVFN